MTDFVHIRGSTVHAPTALELLEVWEQGSGESPTQRALLLLAAACPGTPRETLVRLSIGQRDTHLLMLRELIFGSQLVSLTDCPSCSERVELNLQTAEIRAAAQSERQPMQEMSVGDYQVRFRLPSSEDLLVVDDDIAVGSRQLLARCIESGRRAGEECAAEELPAAVISAVSERMAVVDPLADVQLNLSCPACEHRWSTGFDIVSFLWREIDALVRRLLREVHVLASAYGWLEADILSLSAERRHIYLELVGE